MDVFGMVTPDAYVENYQHRTLNSGTKKLAEMSNAIIELLHYFGD
jgi:hypothetical protein